MMMNKEIDLLVPELCMQPGADSAAAMAFGDGLNDTIMKQTAEMGADVGNAAQPIKNTAGFITDTNGHDSAAKAAQYFCLYE